MASNVDWANAMHDRLLDALPSEWDQETKEMIGHAFLGGMAEYPDILRQLKSSSLIESDYFDDQGEDSDQRIIEGNRYKIRVKTSNRK